MKNRSILLLTILILFTNVVNLDARPRRSKSCIPKVLLPGHSKPIKCNKARKIKNSYF
jgi:hypothetical protein